MTPDVTPHLENAIHSTHPRDNTEGKQRLGKLI